VLRASEDLRLFGRKREEVTVIKVLLPTDAQTNCFQMSIEICIKIKIAATCFGVIAIIRERTV